MKEKSFKYNFTYKVSLQSIISQNDINITVILKFGLITCTRNGRLENDICVNLQSFNYFMEKRKQSVEEITANIFTVHFLFGNTHYTPLRSMISRPNMPTIMIANRKTTHSEKKVSH